MSEEYSYVGKNIERIDAFEKVTGNAIYTQDIELPGMLHAKFKKSPRPHAKITSIDTSKAEELAGVRTVITGKDVPFKFGKYIQDRDILARKKVRYVGEPVAAVAADTEEIAEKAIDLIDVEYKDLEPIFNAQKALKDDSPRVHEDLGEYNHAPFIFPIPDTNMANHFKLRKGDVEKGFDKADRIIENTFDQPQTQHVEMETHTTIAQWTPEDKLKIWTSAQAPFIVRENMSHLFDIPINKVDVYTPYLGGGFGGKAGVNWEPLPCILSRESGGRPVKLELTREEQFSSSSIRQGLTARIKTGVKENGEITAMEIEYIWDSGAYADYTVNVGRASGYASTGPYEIPNVKTDSYTVYTNRPYGTAFRGFGHVPFHWATERQMDLIAHELDMDPTEFRLKNALLPGGVSATGAKLENKIGRLDECIKAVKKELEKGSSKESEDGKIRGIGIAGFWKAPAMPANTSSSALVKMNQDGTVTLSVSTSQMGQGTVTSLSQMVAEELDISPEKIHVPNHTETDLSTYTWQTVGSRGMFMDGRAVLDAVEDAKNQLKEIASELLNVPKEELTISDGKVVAKNEDKNLPFSEIALGGTYPSGGGFAGPVVGYGVYTAEGLSNLDPETGQGKPGLFWTVGARGAEVEVDPETADVRITKLVTSFDLGKAVNPKLVHGQIYGGSVQHLGSTISEEYIYDDEGRMLNNNLMDYKIPRALDIPDEFVNILIENPQENGPFGARGVGELGMISVAPAIGNAIYDAIEVNINDLPISRENLWKKFCEVKGE
ncbi:MAG: xanthine dehydrogenase family protein molybdopterin-binding subunit [Hadesarchaea archaeon]|nr:xanthine dehydrogenase family protein molybdopterin-binding subunit [Hadesarchaea archaeon]